MRPRQWLIILLCAAVVGCGTTPQTRYYILDTTPTYSLERLTNSLERPENSPERPDREQDMAAGVVNVGLGRVELPGYLDPTRMVRRTGPNTLSVDQFERWSEPLEEGVQRVLAANLSTLPGVRIYRLPTPRGLVQDYRIGLHIVRFDADEEGAVRLEGIWSLSADRNDPALAQNAFHFNVPSQGASNAAIAAAMSEALGELSHQIAETILQRL